MHHVLLGELSFVNELCRGGLMHVLSNLGLMDKLLGSFMSHELILRSDHLVNSGGSLVGAIVVVLLVDVDLVVVRSIIILVVMVRVLTLMGRSSDRH